MGEAMMTEHEIEAICRRVSGHLAEDLVAIKKEAHANKLVLERLERTILKGDLDGGLLPLTMRVKALETATTIQDLHTEIAAQKERIDGLIQQNKDQRTFMRGLGVGLGVITIGGSAGVYAILQTLLQMLGGP